MTKQEILVLIRFEGCAICGTTPQDLRDIEFHHLGSRTKKHNIADMYSYSRASILEEVKKCKAVCGDCHKALHKDLGKKVTIAQSKQYIKEHKSL